MLTNVNNMKRTALASLALLAVLSVTGCSAAAGLGDYASMPEDMGAPQSEDGAFNDQDGADVDDSARFEIITGQMTVIAEAPVEAAADAIRIVEMAGGRIDGREESAPANGDKGSATLTLRIPSEKLDATINKLKGLGELDGLETNAVDVSAQVKDIDARVKSLQISVDRLSAFLASAKNITDLLALEETLSSRQSELESMLAQQRSIAAQVSLATITLYLISEADAPADPPPATFLSGLETGWNSFTTFISGVVVVFGVLLPWLVFFALIAFVIVVVVRVISRRSARAATPSE